MPFRPKSLREVAQEASTLEAWGSGLAEFLDEVNAIRLRDGSSALLDLVKDEPPALKLRFEQGETADAFAAALAEHLAHEATVPAPAWTSKQERYLTKAWFPLSQIAELPNLRSLVESSTPQSFRNHNIFVDENSLVRA
jgi:hypothetical protein